MVHRAFYSFIIKAWKWTEEVRLNHCLKHIFIKPIVLFQFYFDIVALSLELMSFVCYRETEASSLK